MFRFQGKTGISSTAILRALDRSLAIIEFGADGTIITANANFCSAMGYELGEIAGKHHSMFIDPVEAQSAEYREFWAKLARGEFDARQYKRFGKGGKEIWIEAAYNPVLSGGKVAGTLTGSLQLIFERREDAWPLDPP